MTSEHDTTRDLLEEAAGLRRRLDEIARELSAAGVTFVQCETDLEAARQDKERMEDELYRQRLFLDSVVDNIPDMIFVKEVDELRFEFFNRAGEELLGHKREELYGRNDYDFFPKEQADFFIQKDRSVLEDKVLLDIPEEFIDTPKGTRILHTKKIPIFDEHGNPVFLLGISEDITEKKGVEQRLQRQTQFLDSIVENIPNMIFVKDATTFSYQLVNRACEKSVGLTRDVILGKDDYDLYPPAVADELRDEDERVVAENTMVVTEEEPFGTSQGERFFTTRKLSITGENGEIQYILGIAEDVTERIAVREELERYRDKLEELVAARTEELRRANRELEHEIRERRRVEEALRRESELLASIADTSPVGIVVHDLDGNILFANRFMGTIFGFDREVMTELKFNSEEWRITGYDGKEFPDDQLPFSQVIRTRQPVLNIRHAVERDDRRILLSVNAAPLLEADGGVSAVVTTVADITELIMREKALEESEAKFRNIIESSPMGIYIYRLDAHDDLIFSGANAAADEIIGMNNNRYMGLKIEEAFPGLKDTEVPEMYRRVAREGVAWKLDQVVYEDDLIKGVFEIHAFQTSQNHMAVMFQDVAARIRADQEIRRLNEELEQRVADRTAQLEAANRELSSFAYSVSHDLRAPLRSINGFSVALKEDFGHLLPDAGLAFLDRILNATKRMEQLITDILGLSRLTRSSLHRERINLSTMATDILSELAKADPGRDVSWVVQPGIKGLADARLMEVVLYNLLDNAWKFTGATASPRIEFGTTARDSLPEEVLGVLGEGVIYHVSDNGAGFDMTYADQLFGAFRRLHSIDEFPGTGIGLATVARIIHRHGGSVWAHGEVDKGATFYFTLMRG